MINIEPNFYGKDVCDSCGMTLDPNKIKDLVIVNDFTQKAKGHIALCEDCRKALKKFLEKE